MCLTEIEDNLSSKAHTGKMHKTPIRQTRGYKPDPKHFLSLKPLKNSEISQKQLFVHKSLTVPEIFPLGDFKRIKSGPNPPYFLPFAYQSADLKPTVLTSSISDVIYWRTCFPTYLC